MFSLPIVMSSAMGRRTGAESKVERRGGEKGGNNSGLALILSEVGHFVLI